MKTMTEEERTELERLFAGIPCADDETVQIILDDMRRKRDEKTRWILDRRKRQSLGCGHTYKGSSDQNECNARELRELRELPGL